MSTVRVLLEEPCPRARQAVEWVLVSILGYVVHWAGSVEDLTATDGPRLVYGTHRINGAMHVVPSGWLKEKGHAAFEAPLGSRSGSPVLFPGDGQLQFDVFAAVFYLLSRHEEWSGMPSDVHGRPLTRAFHAARHGYLHRPIVDEWAMMLFDAWKIVDPALAAPQRRYQQVITVDLDNGLKYGGRPLWRTAGSALRDLMRGSGDEIKERFAVLRGSRPDPFLIDQELKDAFVHAKDLVFFVLAADRGRHDHAVPVEVPTYATALRALAEWARIGIHPSYESSMRPGTIATEMARLQHITNRPITASRQHFLRLKVPDTFRELESSGICEDHTLGIHDAIGFRCGTCTPYPWYDLEQERRTSLMIHPFTVMDNTLSEKLRLAPGDVTAAVRPAIEAIRRVGGTFTGLWHESFLAATGPRKAWRSVILQIIHEARP